MSVVPEDIGLEFKALATPLEIGTLKVSSSFKRVETGSLDFNKYSISSSSN